MDRSASLENFTESSMKCNDDCGPEQNTREPTIYPKSESAILEKDLCSMSTLNVCFLGFRLTLIRSSGVKRIAIQTLNSWQE